MLCTVCIPVDGYMRCFYLLHHGDSQRIEVEGVVILDVWKVHDHRYELEGFFYVRKLILSRRTFATKKELHGAIQKFLQENL